MKGFLAAIGVFTLIGATVFGIDGVSQYALAKMTTHQTVAIGLMQMSGICLLITCVCWSAFLITSKKETTDVFRDHTNMIRRDLKDLIKKK